MAAVLGITPLTTWYFKISAKAAVSFKSSASVPTALNAASVGAKIVYVPVQNTDYMLTQILKTIFLLCSEDSSLN